MSVTGSQQQTTLRLLTALRPHWHRDPALPLRIQSLFAQNKAFGSRDRRLYRELIYTALRYLPWIERWLDAEPNRAMKIIAWLAVDTRDTNRFKTEVSGDWPVLTTLAERAKFLNEDTTAVLPAWIREECPALFSEAELEAQVARAPVWLRLQTDATAAIAEEFAAAGWAWEPSVLRPDAWRMLGDIDVTKSRAYETGKIEIQDLGSQLVLASAGISPGARWLDACAGAGGKTLQLARLVAPGGGRIDAHDIRPAALAELRVRAQRAGIANVTIIPAIGPASYDGVLVDAPCSGSGTWRRAPHLKWATSERTAANKAGLQLRLLQQFSAAVKAGGRLVYATCSLARIENEAVIEKFVAANPEFAVEPPAHDFGYATTSLGLTIMPSRHDTDGFFVASLRRQG